VPFARPTVAELIARAKSDLRGRLEVGGSLLRRAMADVLGAVWGGTVHTLYGYLDWLAKQLFGDTAERESLLRMAALYGITPVPATYATGTATATGTNGSVIPINTILKLDAATSYRVTTGQVIAGGVAALPITAVLAGSAANIPLGTSLTFESSIAGVYATATVAGDITNGVDEEGTEELRARYLLRLREPPEGGSDQDYIAWALAVPGVTRAWVYRNEIGRGTVVVRFVRDNDVSIFPDAGEVAAVQAKFAAERPTTAEVTAMAPTALVVAFTIHLVPDTADTRTAVVAELTDLLARRAEPGDGVARGKVLLSEIRTAIGTAAGVTDYTLTLPAADVVPGLGQLATVGVPTWT
jgi:uncharacterized phage protein gp47/JayE